MMEKEGMGKGTVKGNSYTLMAQFMKGYGKTINDTGMDSFQFQTTLTSRGTGTKTS